jgi:hypothetical protein
MALRLGESPNGSRLSLQSSRVGLHGSRVSLYRPREGLNISRVGLNSFRVSLHGSRVRNIYCQKLGHLGVYFGLSHLNTKEEKNHVLCTVTTYA